MDSCKRFNEMLFPAKNKFHSNLTVENITDLDYKHAERVWIDFGIQNVGDYNDMYVKSDELLLF